jgi:hypothetical protein
MARRRRHQANAVLGSRRREKSSAGAMGALTSEQNRTTAINSVPEMVDLMGVAAGPERPQLAAACHSQKRDAFPALETGPVKGMGI